MDSGRGLLRVSGKMKQRPAAKVASIQNIKLGRPIQIFPYKIHERTLVLWLLKGESHEIHGLANRCLFNSLFRLAYKNSALLPFVKGIHWWIPSHTLQRTPCHDLTMAKMTPFVPPYRYGYPFCTNTKFAEIIERKHLWWGEPLLSCQKYCEILCIRKLMLNMWSTSTIKTHYKSW